MTTYTSAPQLQHPSELTLNVRLYDPIFPPIRKCAYCCCQLARTPTDNTLDTIYVGQQSLRLSNCRHFEISQTVQHPKTRGVYLGGGELLGKFHVILRRAAAVQLVRALHRGPELSSARVIVACTATATQEHQPLFW
jgi:hypothetical protein